MAVAGGTLGTQFLRAGATSLWGTWCLWSFAFLGQVIQRSGWSCSDVSCSDDWCPSPCCPLLPLPAVCCGSSQVSDSLLIFFLWSTGYNKTKHVNANNAINTGASAEPDFCLTCHQSLVPAGNQTLLGSCQQLLSVLYTNNLQVWQKYRLFYLDPQFFLSVSPLQDFLTSPSPFHPFSALAAALWLCSAGAAQRSCRAGLCCDDSCWRGGAHSGGGQFLGSPHPPEYMHCLGDSAFALWVSGRRNEGPLKDQIKSLFKAGAVGEHFFFYILPLSAAEIRWGMVCSLEDSSRALPELRSWQISWHWEISQPFSVFWDTLVCPCD